MSRGNKKNKVAYSGAETKNSIETVEFTRKELQCLDQGKIKRELEREVELKGLGNKRMWILQLGKQ